MNRKYARKLYLEKVEKLRNICPDIAITSDMIAGFPGETDADFEKSLDLIKKVEFDGLYAFKYSDRPNAVAARFPKKVSENKKKERLQRILDLQNDFTTKKNKALEGSNQLILVEGFSKKHGKLESQNRPQDIQWTGRTSTNKIVNFFQSDNFSYNENIMGQLVNVRIVEAFSHSLWGKPIGVETSSYGLRGEESHVA